MFMLNKMNKESAITSVSSLETNTVKQQPTSSSDGLEILLGEFDSLKAKTMEKNVSSMATMAVNDDWITRVAAEIFARMENTESTEDDNNNEVDASSLKNNKKEEQKIVELLTKFMESSTKSWTEGYDKHRITISHLLFQRLIGGSENATEAFNNLKEISSHIVDLRCREIWEGNHSAYRCATCGLSNASCLCIFCFDPDLHVGHDYKMYSSNAGGCCDCGEGHA